MRKSGRCLVRLAAAAVFAAGVGAAHRIDSEPVRIDTPGADLLRDLARRSGLYDLTRAPLDPPAPPAAPLVEQPGRETPAAVVPPSAPTVEAAPESGPEARPAAEAYPAPSAPAEVPAAPVKSVGLLAVTDAGEKELAWLVDLANGRREMAGEGETAHGFTVLEVKPEGVVLAAHGEEFPLRLGEKRWAASGSAAGAAVP